jgi:acyl-CoA synthetase (AMP-forming)/AMP-acid ligase II/acyl carrier protein
MTFTTFVDILASRAVNQPTERAFTFLPDGELAAPVHSTYRELDQRARQTARLVRASVETAGQPVLLLFPPGLDVIAALFGCFYAGAIAVIADFPRRRSPSSPIDAIIIDAGVTVGLTSCLDDIEPYLSRSETLRQLRWLTLEDIAGSPPSVDIEPPAVDPEAIALLQYTSGSTDTPKGVMVTHANLVHNSGVITRRFLQTENSRTVFWLPLSHDMGLVGGVLQPLYVGFPGTLMPPLSFLQRPTRWLQAISACGATTSAAPNFAYDLCVRKTTPAQRESLDLSTWTVAINGAEPVRAKTIESFSEFFGPCGFRREAFCPSYGLAEATLVVSGEKKILPPTIVKESTIGSANPGSDAAAVVGCGGIAQEHTVVIVHPELTCRCKPGEVGEIWVAGDSVARGYWNRVDETETTFGGYLSDSGEGPFLRTGDLGCLLNDELFIAGRLKDVIIVRGVNYSPYALEQTVEKCHPSLRVSCGAAFVVQAGDRQRLVVVHELERNFLRTVPEQEVFHAIRQAVSEEHGLEVHSIVLLRPASLPKTVTNKTKRHTSREAYLNGTLNAVAQWSSPETGPVAVSNAPAPPVSAARGREEMLRVWLMEKLSRQLNIPAKEMDVRRPFAEYGFDSAAVVELAGDLEDYLGCELSPTLVYDYPTVESLCLYLAHAPRASGAGEQTGSHAWNP